MKKLQFCEDSLQKNSARPCRTCCVVELFGNKTQNAQLLLALSRYGPVSDYSVLDQCSNFFSSNFNKIQVDFKASLLEMVLTEM